jgi:hypothetical protein
MRDTTGRAVFLVLGGFLLVSCGGSAAPAEEPVSEPPPYAGTESPPQSEEGANDSQPAQESSAESASPEDFQAALQVVIQDEALLRELKLEEPGRFPLKISGGALPTRLELVVQTKAVEVVPAPEDPKKEPVLVFTEIELSAAEGMFKYRYEIEGVRGTSYVFKGPAGWELKSSRVSGY